MLPDQWAAEARGSGVAGLVAGAALLALSGVAACVGMNTARRRVRAPRAGRYRIDGAGRLPQGVVTPLTATAAGFAAWWFLRGLPPAANPGFATPIGGIILLLAFPALIAERFAAATPDAILPEAAHLRRLLTVPVAVLALAGALEILRGEGMVWPGRAIFAVAAAIAAIAAELALRGLARWFQPPTEPMRARAAIGSLLADLPGMLARPGGVAAPLRDHFGLDFSRSWALGYLRHAALPAAALTALGWWGLTGIVLLPLDGRGVYERFGDPVAVLGPGLHATLPWPLGRVRPVEFGAVHEIPLGSEFAPPPLVNAEAPAPPEADRLWDQPHPGEANWLIAGGGAAGQSFQVMSADIRILYRVGLTNSDAVHALYGVADPDMLVRMVAGRTISGFFAARTLDSVLDQRREHMAAEMQTALETAIDRPRSGLEIVSVTLEAVHPPAGAAAAYHNVQAAEIIANTGIATETGRARGTASFARSQSWDVLDKSKAAAAETIAAADADARRFNGDVAAHDAGGRSFLLERYFQTVSAAMAKAPLTIIDHRVVPNMAPVIDLRPYAAAAKSLGDGD